MSISDWFPPRRWVSVLSIWLGAFLLLSAVLVSSVRWGNVNTLAPPIALGVAIGLYIWLLVLGALGRRYSFLFAGIIAIAAALNWKLIWKILQLNEGAFFLTCIATFLILAMSARGQIKSPMTRS